MSNLKASPPSIAIYLLLSHFGLISATRPQSRSQYTRCKINYYIGFQCLIVNIIHNLGRLESWQSRNTVALA